MSTASSASVIPPPGASITTLPPAEMAKLAFELVAGLLPLPDIISRHQITRTDLKHLLRNTLFRNMVSEAKRVWHSPLNAKQRIRVKAQMAVEDGLELLYAVFCNESNALQPRLDAYKQLTQLADALPKKDAESGDTGPVFSVTIKFGSRQLAIAAQRSALPPADSIIEGEGAVDAAVYAES